MTMTLTIGSNDLLNLAITVCVAGFAWCLGCGLYALLAHALAGLRSRRP